MAEIGKINSLPIIESSDHGFYLDGGEHGKILLPNAYIDTSMEIGKTLSVFIYGDSEDRLVATTETPKAQAGEFACLSIVNIHPRMGIFLDWGLQKDLLLPYRETGDRSFRPGDHVVVAVSVDPHTNRIVASTRLHRHFSRDFPDYQPDQPVDILIYGSSPLGFKAIVDKRHAGLLFRGETSDRLRIGDQFTGFIKKVHEDGKIDVLRDRPGYKKRISPISDRILEKLAASEGFLPLNDKSPPERIRTEFGCSKQAFKQALGNLYKQKKIVIGVKGIQRP